VTSTEENFHSKRRRHLRSNDPRGIENRSVDLWTDGSGASTSCGSGKNQTSFDPDHVRLSSSMRFLGRKGALQLAAAVLRHHSHDSGLIWIPLSRRTEAVNGGEPCESRSDSVRVYWPPSSRSVCSRRRLREAQSSSRTRRCSPGRPPRDHFGHADVGFADGDFNCDGAVDGADYTLWMDSHLSERSD